MNKNFFSALLLEKIGMSLILIVIIIVASFNIIGNIDDDRHGKEPGDRDLKIHGCALAEYHENIHVCRIDHRRRGNGVRGDHRLRRRATLILKTNLMMLPKDVYQVSHLPLSITSMDVMSHFLRLTGISFLPRFILHGKRQNRTRGSIEI